MCIRDRGTSLPELLVSLFSIFKHNTSNDIGNLVSSSIVIGNILGSNIANIALVMGFCAVIHNIVLNINILKDLLFITLLGFYVLVCVYYEIPINYIHGILLLASFIAYFYYLIKNNSNNENEIDNNTKSLFICLIIIFISIDGLSFGTNLIVDNALKYSEPNPQITIETLFEKNHTTIKVSDNGVGIPKEFISKVSNKFFMVPTGKIHNVKGFGLGLFYVNEICKAHNWTWKINSTENLSLIHI